MGMTASCFTALYSSKLETPRRYVWEGLQAPGPGIALTKRYRAYTVPEACASRLLDRQCTGSHISDMLYMVMDTV